MNSKKPTRSYPHLTLCLFAVFSTVLNIFVSGILIAENPQILGHQASQTQKIVKALLMEKQNLHEDALNIWEHFASDSTIAQDHILQNKILSYEATSYDQIPSSETSLLLISRYLFWQMRWKKAFEILDKVGSQKHRTVKIQLEKVRLALYLGEYAQAREILLSLEKVSEQVGLEQQVYWCWYYLLTQNNTAVSQKLVEIEDQYLYIPYGLLIPYGSDISNSLLDKQLFRALLRFPADKALFEEIILILKSQSHWERVEWLIQTQELLFGKSANTNTYRRIYLHASGLTAEEQKGVRLRGDEPPEYFDMIAQKAILDKNWKLLEVISNQYIEKYPMLYDGKLYLNEYIQHMNQTDRVH